MLLHRKLPLTLALLGLALSAPRAGATILVIDDFNAPAISAPDTDPVSVEVTGGTASAQRVTTITLNDTMATDGLGNLKITEISPATGTITWTPTSGTFDFSDSGLNFAFAVDIGAAVGTWTATIFASDGTHSDSVDKSGTSGTTQFFNFADFLDGVNPVNMAALTQLELTLTDMTGSSITIGQIRAVPEPSTAGMLLVGLLGLARAGRRPKAAA